MNTSDSRIPVTLLTGFLGAGKTTLLNALLRDPDAGRIVVVINEFGDIGLDHDLVAESTEETVLLPSGCLCCSIRGDLAQTLGSLFAKKEAGDLDFDRVVIETTGIAEPGPILHTLVVEEGIAPRFRMDGVVTLADAALGPSTLVTQEEAVHQVAMADLIVVTKTDLVSQGDADAFERDLSAINSHAGRIQAQHGRVPVSALFGISALHKDATPEDAKAWLGVRHGVDVEALETDREHDHAHHGHHHHHHDHDHHHDHHHDHSHGIVSAAIELHDPIPASVFDLWLDTLIALKGPDILRVKGIVHVEDVQWPFVFHGVQHIFDAPVPMETWTGGGKTSRIVVIARNMTQAEVNASLDMLRLKPQEFEETSEGMISHSIQMPL